MSGGYVPTLEVKDRIEHPSNARQSVDPFLRYLLDAGGSDLHLVVGYPPRISDASGDVVDIEGFQYTIDTEFVDDLAFNMFGRDEKRLTRFRQIGDANLAYEYTEDLRFRVNLAMERGNISFTFRAIADKAVPFNKLGLPNHMEQLTNLTSGLVLIGGKTGSGKSTTLNSLVDRFNEHYPYKIVTLESPIEYYHKPKRATIIQREVNEEGLGDALSYTAGIRNALRQKPDIILMGEMTGAPEIEAAVKAAETGHLVLGTVHTRNVKDTIDRIISDVPTEAQNKVRGSLAESLQFIMCQELCPTLHEVNGRKQVLAYENLYIESNARNLIRHGQTHELLSYFNGDDRNITMDRSLAELVNTGVISMETALLKTSNENSLRTYVKNRPSTERGGPGLY